MLKKIIYLSFLGFLVLATNYADKRETTLPDEHSVTQLLETLGDQPAAHKPNLNLAGTSVQRGKDIVENGMSKEGGQRSRRQSKYFTCIACHNREREDPDLANPEPKGRLQYVKEKGLPFLQASPLYGIINRTTFYNGDYEKKYGDLVKPTRNNLREAIQLCAVECSQGRRLAPWEVESVLAYFWTIGLKVADLNLTEEEFSTVSKAFDLGIDRKKAIDIVKSKYLDHSPATFVEPPQDRTNGDGLLGNPTNGQLIYELSCQHCHFKNEYAFLVLDNSELTFKHLLNEAITYKPHSIYQVIRYGTQPKGGKRGYMPQYTKEKMTDQQMADLRAYIELKGNIKGSS